jgi:hypothetical protein
MTDAECNYWKKRDQIVEADLIWLAQRHVTNAVESLTERGYDRNSHAIRELQSIIDRLSKLAAVVQIGIEEDASELLLSVREEEGADADRESETHFARYGN